MTRTRMIKMLMLFAMIAGGNVLFTGRARAEPACDVNACNSGCSSSEGCAARGCSGCSCFPNPFDASPLPGSCVN
jgi:hypothetical protein